MKPTNSYYSINTKYFFFTQTNIYISALMIHGDFLISAVMVHHIKPPKPAMAWFSQSESVSEKSCASAVWTGEK